MLQPPSGRLRAIALGAALAALGPLLAAQTTREESIYAAVTRGQHIIRGLEAQNFRVLLDGQPAAFRLEPPERPVSIALLAEYSRSSAPYLNDILQAVNSFVQAAPEGDWYALATFSNRLSVAQDFTKLKGQIPVALAERGAPQYSEIATYDAVHDMLDKMARLPGRRVLVLIGSGRNTFGSHTLGEVRAQLAASNVTVFCIGAAESARLRSRAAAHTSFIQADALLRALAQESGGEAWFPRFSTAFPDAIAALLQTLEQQYRLVVAAPSAHRRIALRVEAFATVAGKRQTYSVRARSTLAAP